jgi:hypothetical protein
VSPLELPTRFTNPENAVVPALWQPAPLNAYFAVLPTMWRATTRSIPGTWVALMIQPQEALDVVLGQE